MVATLLRSCEFPDGVSGSLDRACPKIRKIGPTSGPGPGGRPENVEGDDFRASIGGIQGRSKAA